MMQVRAIYAGMATRIHAKQRSQKDQVHLQDIKKKTVLLKNVHRLIQQKQMFNIHHKPTQSTYCHNCGEAVIGRDWHELSEWKLQFGGTQLAGVFEEKLGTWGRRRASLKFKT